MSDIIDLLERMGRDSQWRDASPDDIQSAMNDAEITSEVQAAIVAGDQTRLLALLELVPLCGMYAPSKEGEEEEEEEVPPGNDDEKPEHSLSRLPMPVG